MKKLILLLLILSIFATFSSAEIVKNGESIDTPIGDLAVNLYNKEDGFTASVRSSDFRAVLDVGECKIFGLYNICLESAEEVDDYDLGKKVIQGDVTVEELIPTIERSITETEIKEGDEAIVTVKLTNPGDNLQVKYTDTWPKEFLIILPKENTKIYQLNNKVIFDRQLFAEEIFTYKVRLIAPVDKEIKATLEYAGKKITSEGLKIKSKNSLAISSDLDPKDPDLFEKTNLTIKIKNEGDSEAINLNYVNIVFPPGVEVITADSKLTKKGATYEYIDEELKEDIEFSFLVRPTKLGLHIIKINAEAVDAGKTVKSVGEEEIDLEVKELFINMKLSSILFKNTGIQISATIENKNDAVTFKNLNCKMEGLYNKEYTFVQVLPEKALDIENTKFDFEDSSTRTTTQSLKCNYETNTGEKMSTIKSKEILINLSSAGEVDEETNDESEDSDAEVDEEESDSEEDESDDEQNVIIEDDKPGFFSRIINFFKRIFSTKPAFEDNSAE